MRLKHDKLDYSVLMRKILLQTHVRRSERAPMVAGTIDENILETTYQDLENIGLVLIKSRKDYAYIQYLLIPPIFGEIYTSRVSSPFPFLSQFMDVESWQQWETFQVCYLSFRHNLLVEEYGSTTEDIPLGILFQGAHFSKKTGQYRLRLNKKVQYATCVHQFPNDIKEDRIKIEYKSGNSVTKMEEIQWKTDLFYFLNAPFGDAFHIYIDEVSGKCVFLSFQLKYVHDNTFSLEMIQKDHKRNVLSVQHFKQEKGEKEPFVITIFITAESFPVEVNMEALDRIIIVSRDRFEEYYGNIISRIACSKLVKN
jgi:hypothetical protein